MDYYVLHVHVCTGAYNVCIYMCKCTVYTCTCTCVCLWVSPPVLLLLAHWYTQQSNTTTTANSTMAAAPPDAIPTMATVVSGAGERDGERSEQRERKQGGKKFNKQRNLTMEQKHIITYVYPPLKISMSTISQP